MTRKSGDLPSDAYRNSGGASGTGLIVHRPTNLCHAFALRAEGASMIWETNTHRFSATLCQRTGAPCPALAQMARALAHAMLSAQPVTDSEFEIEGSIELSHCPQGCIARFQARCGRIRVFCGADPEMATDRLDGYADLMFAPATSSLPSDLFRNPPCAMLEATALTPQSSGEISPQVGV